MLSQNKIKKYVPRHLRLGSPVSPFQVEAFQDVVETIPVVDSEGSVVHTNNVVKSVPASDVMSKYKVSAFRLTALVKAGVPLKVVNVNASNVATIEQLKNVCESIDSADAYVNRVLAERKEREAWLQPESSTSSNVES